MEKKRKIDDEESAAEEGGDAEEEKRRKKKSQRERRKGGRTLVLDDFDEEEEEEDGVRTSAMKMLMKHCFVDMMEFRCKELDNKHRELDRAINQMLKNANLVEQKISGILNKKNALLHDDNEETYDPQEIAASSQSLQQLMQQIEERLLALDQEPVLELKVKILSSSATLPVKATQGAAAWDLFSNEDASIEPYERKWVSTGLAFEIPEDHTLFVRSRSGYFCKRVQKKDNDSDPMDIKVDAFDGTIDCDYRGEVKVGIHNANLQGPFHIKTGDRIAQIVLLKIPKVQMVVTDKLSETNRGSGGFGSTGIREV